MSAVIFCPAEKFSRYNEPATEHHSNHKMFGVTVELWNNSSLFPVACPSGSVVLNGVIDPLIISSNERIQPPLFAVHGEKCCGHDGSWVRVQSGQGMG